MQIGPYRVDVVETGRFALDGGAMFGVVPKPLWSRALPSDELNRIPMAMKALLLRGDGRTILVDTGAGHKLADKLAAIYALDFSRFELLDGLKSLGVAPDSVTDVILTHLHFDHTGGATRIDPATGAVVPTFANATHHVQRQQWDWALAPTERDRASFMSENFVPLDEAGRLKRVDGAVELLPGIRAVPVHGHTPGQQMIRVDGGDGAALLYAADLVPTHHHLPLPYIMGYDLSPLVTLEEKRTHLMQAADDGTIVVFEHDAFRTAATLRRDPKRGVALADDRSAELLPADPSAD